MYENHCKIHSESQQKQTLKICDWIKVSKTSMPCCVLWLCTDADVFWYKWKQFLDSLAITSNYKQLIFLWPITIKLRDYCKYKTKTFSIWLNEIYKNRALYNVMLQ
jgi:hypothetical protein